MDIVSDASDVSEGKMVDDSLNWGPVIVVATGGVVMLVGALGAGSHINQSVAMYNEQEKPRQGVLDPLLEKVSAVIQIHRG